MAKIELKEVIVNGKKILIRANDEEFNSKLDLRQAPVAPVEEEVKEEEPVVAPVVAPKSSKKK